MSTFRYRSRRRNQNNGYTAPCPTNPFDFCIGQWGDKTRDNAWRFERWYWNQLDAHHPTQYHLLTRRGFDCCHMTTFCWKDYNPGINDHQRPEHFADQISEEQWEEKIGKVNGSIDRAHRFGSYCRGFWMALIPCTMCLSCVCVEYYHDSDQQCCCCCPEFCQDYQKKHVLNSLQPICEEISDDKLIWKPIYKHARDYKGDDMLEYLRLEVKLKVSIEPFEMVRLLPEEQWDTKDLRETKTKLGAERNSCIMQLLGAFCGSCFEIPGYIENVQIQEAFSVKYFLAPPCVCFQNIFECGLDAKGRRTVYSPPTQPPPGWLGMGAQVTKAPDCTKKGVLDDGCIGVVEKGPDSNGDYKVRVASKKDYNFYQEDQLVVVDPLPLIEAVVGGPSSSIEAVVGGPSRVHQPASDGPASDTQVRIQMEEKRN